MPLQLAAHVPELLGELAVVAGALLRVLEHRDELVLHAGERVGVAAGAGGVVPHEQPADPDEQDVVLPVVVVADRGRGRAGRAAAPGHLARARARRPRRARARLR